MTDTPLCAATTREGQPCRNRALDGELYCRVHKAAHAKAEEHAAQEEILIVETEPDITVRVTTPAHAQATEAVQELEVEIRNHAPSGHAAQQMALDLLRMIRENIGRLSGQAAEQVQKLLKGRISGDYLDPDFWRGLWMVVEYQINEIRGMVIRRVRGEYTTDPYGMDSEVVELLRPIAGFLYRSWWRVQTSGLEHVPESGAALMVANHAGMVPWDAAMLATAILEEHGSPRVARTLHERWLATVPVLAPTLAAFGQVPAKPENAVRLLGDGELVTVFPEGARAAGKLFRNRYKLAGFEAEQYLQAAVRAGVPIIPVALIGAEEAYPVLANLSGLAKFLKLPALPVTPLFPWLGPIGLLPLPNKWVIKIGAPMDTSSLTPESADDAGTMARLAGELRSEIEHLIQQGLAERGSAFS